MAKYCVLIFLVCFSSSVVAGCWPSKPIEASEIPVKKAELLDIIHEIQRGNADISACYKSAKRLIKRLHIEALNDVLVAISCQQLSELHQQEYILRARSSLLQLAQRIVRKGGDIHYQQDEVFIQAASNFPQLFAYLLKRSEHFKTPYRLATFRIIAERNPNFIYANVINVYIQQLSVPQLAQKEYIEHLAKQLVDNRLLSDVFIERVQTRILSNRVNEVELIADDLIGAILQERDQGITAVSAD